ncbi:MAG: Nramp family divalent metal transporter, partial [Gemmatimonadaceae bacterium]
MSRAKRPRAPVTSSSAHENAGGVEHDNEPAPRGGAISRFWHALGPGVITGAADDDPSGIATYSIAGAQFGTTFLWAAILTWPLMAAVQSMCARIGMVTGKGLMGALEERFPRPVLGAVCLALFIANSINIGADLAGMADAAELVSSIDSHYFVILFAILIGAATIWMRYGMLSNILKWLALVLFAYVITAFLVGPNWGEVARDTFIPTLPKSSSGWSTLVAILGTTIS